MRTYIQPGEVMTFTAPGGGVVAGTPLLIGSLLVIPAASAAAGAEFEGHCVGVHEIPKTAAQAWTEGQKIYWNIGTSLADSDSTTGPLIGAAARVEANPTSTGRVRLNGGVPSTAEGAQGAIVALTDNTGLSGTHDDTLAATAALVALTDSTGLSGTHDDTLAATAALVALTDNTGDSGTHDDTLADGKVATATAALTTSALGDLVATNGGWGSSTEAGFDSIATKFDALVTDVTALKGKIDDCVVDLGVQNQNDSDLAQKVIEVTTQLAVTNQNISDLGQKVIEATNQLAVTNQNISDVAQKVLEIRTALIAAGILAA